MKFFSTVARFVLVGSLASLAACGSKQAPTYGGSVAPKADNRCLLSPSSCRKAPPRYERGERAYAEQAAADLNRQQAARLKAAGWFR